MDPVLGNVNANLDEIERLTEQAVAGGAELVLFPECAVTGYVYDSFEAAFEISAPVPGPVSERLASLTRRLGIYLVAGTLERHGADLFNTALVLDPSGLAASYRKTHTLCLGVDRFTKPGQGPLPVVDLPIGRIGVLICYDLRFPETARVLALDGAQILALPTNWPVASSIQADVFTRSRAAENRIWVLAANRVGVENGATFLGRSQVVAPDGSVLREGSRDRVEMLIVDIDPNEADSKHLVWRPGAHEMDVIADRRPDLYGGLLEPVPVA